MTARTPSIGLSPLRPQERTDFNPSLAALTAALQALRGGTLTMRLPDGRIWSFGDGIGPSAVLQVNDAKFARRVLLNGDIGFAEGWVEGLWDSPDLFALLSLLASNGERLKRYISGGFSGKVLGWLAHLRRANTRAGARRNILAHYDLGNDFYASWLDPSMTYSAARFISADQSLEDAQADKYRALARAIDLKPGERVLEIGCGWGGFAELAAREFGAHITGLTISDAQYEFANARMRKAGLAERVAIRRQDYRDVSGAFDKVVSIEMLEAVGEKYWPAFFGKVSDVLKPGGKAAVQVITIRDDLFEAYRARVDFIQRCVFPGGMLPSIAALKREAAYANLSWFGAEYDAASYDKTLRAWARRFEAQWPSIREHGFDERFRRFWLYYLAYCAAGFATGRTDLARITLQRP